MKITKQYLKQIIKEELKNVLVLREQFIDPKNPQRSKPGYQKKYESALKKMIVKRGVGPGRIHKTVDERDEALSRRVAEKSGPSPELWSDHRSREDNLQAWRKSWTENFGAPPVGVYETEDGKYLGYAGWKTPETKPAGEPSVKTAASLRTRAAKHAGEKKAKTQAKTAAAAAAPEAPAVPAAKPAAPAAKPAAPAAKPAAPAAEPAVPAVPATTGTIKPGMKRKDVVNILRTQGHDPRGKWWKKLKYSDPLRQQYRAWYKKYYNK